MPGLDLKMFVLKRVLFIMKMEGVMFVVWCDGNICWCAFIDVHEDTYFYVYFQYV